MQPEFIEFLKLNYSSIPDDASPKNGHVLYIYSDQERDFSKAAGALLSILEQSFQNQFSAIQFVKRAMRSSIKRMIIKFRKMSNDERRESFAGKDFRLPGSSLAAPEVHTNTDEESTASIPRRHRNSSSTGSHPDSDLSRLQQEAVASPERGSPVRRNSAAASETSRSLRDRLKLKRSSSNPRPSPESVHPVENGLSSEIEGLSPTFGRSLRRSTEIRTKASMSAMKVSRAKDADQEQEEACSISSRISTPKRSPMKSPTKSRLAEEVGLLVATEEDSHIINAPASPAGSEERTTQVAEGSESEATGASGLRCNLFSAETGGEQWSDIKAAAVDPEDITEGEISADEIRNGKDDQSQEIYDTETASEELEPMDCDQSGDVAITSCFPALESEKENGQFDGQASESRLSHESEPSRTNSCRSVASERRDNDEVVEEKERDSREGISVEQSNSPQLAALDQTDRHESASVKQTDTQRISRGEDEVDEVSGLAEIESNEVDSVAADQVSTNQEIVPNKVDEEAESLLVNCHESAEAEPTNLPKPVEPECANRQDSLELETMEVDEEEEEEEPSPVVTRRRSSRTLTSVRSKAKSGSADRNEKEDSRKEKGEGKKVETEAVDKKDAKRRESSKKATSQGKKNVEQERALVTLDKKKLASKNEPAGGSKKKDFVMKAKVVPVKSEVESDSDNDLEDFVTAPTLRSSKKRSDGKKDTSSSSRLADANVKTLDEKKDHDRSKSRSASKSDESRKRRESGEKSKEKHADVQDTNETPRSSRNREKRRVSEERKESEASKAKSTPKLSSSKVLPESSADEKDDFVTPRSSRSREQKKNTQEEKEKEDLKTKTTVKSKDSAVARPESETEKKRESVTTVSPRPSRRKEKEDAKNKAIKPNDNDKLGAESEKEENDLSLLSRSSRSKDRTKKPEGKKDENSRTKTTPRSSISETIGIEEEEELSISSESLRSSRLRERKSVSGERKERQVFVVKATHVSNIPSRRKLSESEESSTTKSSSHFSVSKESTTPKSKPSGCKNNDLDHASRGSSEKNKRKEEEEEESSSEDEPAMPRRSRRVSEIEKRTEKKPSEGPPAGCLKEAEAHVVPKPKGSKEKEDARSKATGWKEKGEGKNRLPGPKEDKDEVPLKRRREEAAVEEAKEDEKRRSSRRREPVKVKEEPEEVDMKNRSLDKSPKDHDEVFARRSFRLVERRSMIEFGPPPEIIAAAAAAAAAEDKDELAPDEEEGSVSVFEAPQLRKRPRSQAGEADTASSGSTVAAVAEREAEPRAKRRRQNKAAKEAAESEEEEEAEAEADSDGSSLAPRQTRQRKTATKPKKRNGYKEDTDEESEKEEDDEIEEEDEESEGEKKEEEKEEEKEEYFEFQRLYAAGWARRDPVCPLCEGKAEAGEELLACCGGCHHHYHRRCSDRHLRSLTAPPVPDAATSSTTRTPSRHESESTVDGELESSFRCPECRLGRRRCFLCKEEQADETAPLIRCAVSSCGQMYHEACLRAMTFTRQDSRGLLVCPLHLCHACAIDNPASRTVRQGRMLRCIRCPVSYHAGDFCVASGSTELSGAYIVCPNHFENALMKRYRTINVLWCLICSKGGSLICCEKCPASFHTECIDVERDSVPEKFVCDDCAQGRNPRYGEIVWSKVGHFRWWPCEVLHPRNAPKNIKKLSHQPGQFPIHFFGSDEYCWIHRGRVFSFEGDDYKELKHDDQAGSRLERWYTKGIKKAVRAAKAWREEREEREERQDSKKPYPYKYIKSNYPIGGVKIYKPGEMHEVQRCDCRPANGHTGAATCGTDSDCLNRMLMYECSPALCRGGEHCQNQRFVQRQYPPQEIFKTENLRGWGLRTQANIKKGDFVNEYVGDLIDEDESMRRLLASHENNVTNYYMLTLDRARMIDAGPKGNLSRFMNHSCEPTLETQKWLVNGDFRIGLFALRDIKKGEELTFNYNFQSLGDEAIACRCGAPSCKGFLGAPTEAQARRLQLEEPKPPPPPKGARRSQGAKQGPGGAGKGKRLSALHKGDSEVSLQSLDVGEAAGSTASSTADSSEGGAAGKGSRKRVRNGRGRRSGRMEEVCFRCGEGGELIPCNAERCPKSYHLPCLGIDRVPAGLWFCPWHHCDACGRAASLMCCECTTSYCESHLKDAPMFRPPADPNLVICHDHEDLIAQFSTEVKAKPTEKEKENTTPPRDQPCFEVAASA